MPLAISEFSKFETGSIDGRGGATELVACELDPTNDEAGGGPGGRGGCTGLGGCECSNCKLFTEGGISTADGPGREDAGVGAGKDTTGGNDDETVVAAENCAGGGPLGKGGCICNGG